MIDTARQEA